MNAPRTLVVALFAGGTLPGLASRAMADDEPGVDVTQLAVSQEAAVSIALQSVPGTIAGTELDTEGELTLWEIEIIDGDGRTMDVEIDAGTGEVLTRQSDPDDRNETSDEGDEGDEGNEADEADRGGDESAGPETVRGN